MNAFKKISKTQCTSLIETLKIRFEKNRIRHTAIKWTDVSVKIENKTTKLFSLWKMEETGGEPDVIGFDIKTGEYIFCDCAPESPAGRRSLCYDKDALDARKEHKPKDNAMDVAARMGIDILTEEAYRELQKLGEFDTKTSSWIKTPDQIRKLGGALFCDRRYDHVFVYHNGAESYYAARGFRGMLKI
ncbi:MAG TPA: DUF4256 domain-containing protein [bacterium]|nr:DUF4256 domain-containing protein [bacterium]HMW32950.1 DUF4256 domain-containing protein [bacterium]HMW36526.1 DUF4256 domain-containing protein [bacterium]HMY34688.1 DUF4256 domain-containing protein [bacterium]HMZ03763.1 DUF4256 domain-containing protein [bacterium]